MDDDFSFGASVWGTPSESPVTTSPPKRPTAPSALTSASSSDDQFHDFDSSIPREAGADDDFADFGDFGNAPETSLGGAFDEDISFGDEIEVPAHSVWGPDWEPLNLDPPPSTAALREQVNKLLAPIWPEEGLPEVTTRDDVRQVEGSSQILVTPSSRDLYNNLFQSPPTTRPLNWTRSRIHRQHLISIGIPVNLDEVLPQSHGKPLPPLQITTRPMSTPPAPRPAHSNNPTPGSSRSATPRIGTPQSVAPPESTLQNLGLGPKPELDESKISELITLDADSLSLLPLVRLQRCSTDIREQITNTSTLLTYLLQSRDALQQDAETYNGLIAELVGEAQKFKSGKSRQSKRGSSLV